MPMDPSRLLVLRAVRRAGGVLPAARALHLTPSGVSQHLAKLETEAGVALVDRSRRGGGRTITLTAAGRSLADQAEQVAAALASAEREVDRYKHRRGGVVRVGGFATVLSRLVPAAVVSLALTDPGIDPRISEVDEREGLEQLTGGGLDLLLSDSPVAADFPRPSGIRETALMRDPFRIVMPASWADTEDPETLLRGPWVMPRTQTPSRRAIERVATTYGITLDVRHVGRESGTMLALVSAGLGAAIIPHLTLLQQPRAGVRLFTGALDPGSRTLTVLHPRESDPPVVGRFVDALVHEAAAEQQRLLPDQGR